MFFAKIIEKVLTIIFQNISVNFTSPLKTLIRQFLTPSSCSRPSNTKTGDGPKSRFRSRPGFQVSFSLNLQMHSPKYFDPGQARAFEANLMIVATACSLVYTAERSQGT